MNHSLCGRLEADVYTLGGGYGDPLNRDPSVVPFEVHRGLLFSRVLDGTVLL